MNLKIFQRSIIKITLSNGNSYIAFYCKMFNSFSLELNDAYLLIINHEFGNQRTLIIREIKEVISEEIIDDFNNFELRIGIGKYIQDIFMINNNYKIIKFGIFFKICLS